MLNCYESTISKLYRASIFVKNYEQQTKPLKCLVYMWLLIITKITK